MPDLGDSASVASCQKCHISLNLGHIGFLFWRLPQSRGEPIDYGGSWPVAYPIRDRAIPSAKDFA
ncbi:MAG: hypothetical protein WCA28_02560, partial [Bradyrhizobium sp.]